ncbi:MAG: nucleoid-associated protein [Taibaiella sp.]|nr:nucleoid-associated protein [Taibaiella sp.]
MDLSDSILQQVSVHFVGNKGTGGELILSKVPLRLSEKDKPLMNIPFLSRFTDELSKYAFHNTTSLNYNEVYNFCLEIFADNSTFHENSANIAKHLFENTEHPKIKPGELYICHYTNCTIDNIYVEAIGIYKTETKSNFIDLAIEGNEFDITMREGVEVSKFDKGCLVFPVNAEGGFDVLIADTASKGDEAVFWKEGFLSVLPQANEYFQTNQFLTLTKQYIAKQLPQEFELSKTDQIDLLNKSVEYFRGNEAFDKKKFEEEVFHEKDMIASFRAFGDSYSETNDVELPDSFGISAQAVKKQARVFKSVIKLDGNFHVYIHGDKSLIEKGYDSAIGKSYYKIFFDEES